MISRSRGLSKYSRVLGFHRDETSRVAVVCPVLARRGRCPAHSKELHIRREVAKKKEDELAARAAAMYDLQVEMLAQYREDGSMSEEEARALVGSGFSPEPARRAEMVRRLVAELKQEPEYLNWNIEAEVEERLVLARVRRCGYSHRAALNAAVKRSRREMEKGDETACDSGAEEQERREEARRRQTAQRQRWDAERRRAFASMTDFQRCTACLLWQRRVTVPQSLLCNVRVELEKAEEAARRAAAAAAGVELDEDALDDYLGSEEFARRVAAEETRLVPRVLCRPALGHFDLAALPRIVAHVSAHLRQGLVTPETLAYFTNAATPLMRGGYTEKEFDLSSTARADELTEVLEYMVHVFNTEAGVLGNRAAVDEPPAATAAVGSAAPASSRPPAPSAVESPPPPRVVLRSLSLRACGMTAAEPLVAALHKRQAARTLLALDLSDNRLNSLRFLFNLRAHFGERLLRLSLRNNAITRKPEYQEQVRQCLPRLTSLDGEPIRRPPLRQPRPLPLSHTVTAPGLPEAELERVLDTVARFCYIWEARRVPRTALELASLAAEAEGDAALLAERSAEEEIDEDNFPYRYLHPSATFSLALGDGLSFVDAPRMRLAREVEDDDAYDGMRLSPLDARDLRIFDVVMRSSSRNLVAGRAALSRLVRGPQDCYAAYQLTLYPERMEVDHHLASAVVSVTKVEPPGGRAAARSGTPDSAFGRSAFDAVGRYYLVTLHGVMTWRLPSMRGGECLRAAYTRTLTLVDKLLARSNYDWERRRSPKLVVYNDAVQLRQAPPLADRPAGGAVYAPQTPERLARLVVEFGLEGCRDGAALVRAVMERAASDAAESAALDTLVFGPPPLADTEDSKDSEELFPSAPARRALAAVVAEAHAGESACAAAAAASADSPHFTVVSLLERPNPLRRESRLYQEPQPAEAATPESASAWGTTPHIVTLQMLCRVVDTANTHCTASFRK